MVLVQSPSSGGTQEASDTDYLISFADGKTVDASEENGCREEFDSACSTPYVSAPSSPGRSPVSGYFFSAPASPMHYVLYSAPSATYPSSSESAHFRSTHPVDTKSFEFDFSSRFSSNYSVAVGSMSSADELFLNGQIRPMKLSSHLKRPQILAPLLDLDEGEELEEDQKETEKEEHSDSVKRGRDLKLRSRSLHRKARSLSPLRNSEFQWLQVEDNGKVKHVDNLILDLQEDVAGGKQSETTAVSTETTPSCSASSSRSSSTGRNSKKWIFLKDLLHRSKSEGRGNGKEKFWSSISSFATSSKEKPSPPPTKENEGRRKLKQKQSSKQAGRSAANGVAARKRRVPAPSPHELHYTANRAQAEELKKRTYLPYRQGLLGCLGFSSKGYGALNGLTRALNPVSSG
ncbi:hypothetical protein CJ030_MR8G026865 [Morella rubra]|uniref:Uncharacterized protein n=1 Tax=Morella rubra TaxID=262757 RepID=A0A6A1USR7_9ROSI|nr:hypothetical protein CJ030_MR8G026865 [Morella rubra]